MNTNITEEAVSVEVKDSQKVSAWHKISRRVILALAVLLPFWFLPFGATSLGMSKSILIFAGVLLASIFYLIHILQKGSFKYFNSLAMWVSGAIVLAAFISSLFSGNLKLSFFGVGNEVGTFAFLLASFIAMFLVSVLFQSEKRALTFFSFLMASGLVVFLVEVLRLVFGLSFFGFSADNNISLVGSFNELAVFFGFIALLSVVFLELFKAKGGWRTILYVILGISLAVVALANFTISWYVFGALLFVLFVYMLTFSGKSRNFVHLSLFLILGCLFFVLISPLMGDLSTSIGVNSLDVRPSWGATFQINKSVLSEGVKSMTLGSGPNTFLQKWTQYKPVSINETIFWNINFSSGIGLIPSFIATTGVISALLWLFFIGLLVFYGFRAVTYSGDETTRALLFGSFLGSVYLWIFNIIYTPGNFLFFLSFLVTGVFFALLVKSEKLKSKELAFGDKPSLNFGLSLTIVLLLILGVTGFYFVFQKYWAAYSYTKGINEANSGADLETVQEYFFKAANFDNQSRYHQTLSDIGLVKISQLSTDNLSEEEVASQFQNLLAFTVEHAQLAANFNPEDSSGWVALGNVYENLLPYKIEGVDEVALDAYKKASEKAPTDPFPLLLSARVHAQMGRNEEARTFIESALALKSNYTSARFLLAQIAAQEGNLEDAIKQTELARLTAPNDLGVLFQLGMLYYQSKDFRKSQLAFERVIAINPNYSNARYFLGLAYYQLDNNDGAIEQFEKIKALNPENEEVEKMLSNLKEGLSPLDAISSSELAPEEREDLPIDEDTPAEDEVSVDED
ncbi:MAG: tetratricopeptide repeat protein [Candidatus Marinimicrobia bacterium]|nr:tetratricopeptide repeat protein [Candidatus Neomarinimicrobiota bacterium]